MISSKRGGAGHDERRDTFTGGEGLALERERERDMDRASARKLRVSSIIVELKAREGIKTVLNKRPHVVKSSRPPI